MKTNDNSTGFTGKARHQKAEQRSGKPRRKATADRREMHRFEGEERRSSEDRREGDDPWSTRPDTTSGRKS